MQNDWPNFSKKLINKVGKIISSGKINYTTGIYGKEFEKKFSKFLGNKYSVALCNGTAALEVAIKALKLPKKSEIIVPARSFFSSASSIVNTGHIPVFSDVDYITQNICLKDMQNKITKNTKAIICVHLGGLPCDMYGIRKIAKKNRLKIIEDCSQAHGASIDKKSVGSFGDISTWSFCNDKIISTLGEGGMISTNNKKFYEFCKRYINHGTVVQNKKNFNNFIYNKDFFGTNLRITEIQSFAGLDQLKNLNQIQQRRERIAKKYYNEIKKHKKYFFSYFPKEDTKSAWYRFYFFLKTDLKNYKTIRFKLMALLKQKNIKCFTGSCPEIYLEKSFKKLNKFKIKRLRVCKLLGETSIALDLNHTLSNSLLKKNLVNFKKVIQKII